MTNVLILPKQAIEQQCDVHGMLCEYFVTHQTKRTSWRRHYARIHRNENILWHVGSIHIPLCLVYHTPLQGET